MTAEMACLFPNNGGYLLWVEVSMQIPSHLQSIFGPRVSLLAALNGLSSSLIDLGVCLQSRG